MRSYAILPKIAQSPCTNPQDEHSHPIRYYWLTQGQHTERFDTFAIRAYYYTSSPGDSDSLDKVRRALWDFKFHPEVFHKKKKDDKAKAVDIALAKDMLSHAFLDNYDTSVLVAGDKDYLPLVEEVKRLGKNVWVAFFDNPVGGLSEELRLASDHFVRLDSEIFGSMPPESRISQPQG